ncbi:unnamed protein product [Moneuplotes crassus]|uniref:Uncharacterized protein n=1 Tax=Euplotes crassus TaxID=5936 RepID=A0AAD1UI95_EUPCR|nr:unnamed protein product [Moneuplotes crassus]
MKAVVYFTALLVSLTQAQTCQKVECSKNHKACSTVSGTSVTVNPEFCEDNKVCHYNTEFSHSECMHKLSDPKAEMFLYPGYYCGYYQANVGSVSFYDKAKCVFGEKVCGPTVSAAEFNKKEDSFYVCQGKHTYDQCERHSDCYTYGNKEYDNERGKFVYKGNFCDSGRCTPEVGIGHYCKAHEACGRDGFCLFPDATLDFGYCVEYGSVESNGAQVQANRSGAFLYQQHSEKVCKSGFLDSTNGKCKNGPQSVNKGNTCSSDADCPNTDSTTSSCKCSLDGNKYCDISGGDEEWTNVITKFHKYLNKTPEFHPSEMWGPCMDTPEYKDWYCAEFEAKHYVELLKKPDCFEKVMKYHHDYGEYYKVCLRGSFVTPIVAIAAVVVTYVGMI